MDATPTKQSGGTPNRKAQLEAMSHGDLVQSNLKQTLLLQKLKARYDEVQKTLAEKTKQNAAQLKELQDKLEEKGETETGLLKKFSSTSEQLECTNMKLETLVSSLQCLQNERDELAVKCKESAYEVETANDQLQSIATEKQDLADRLKDYEQQVSGLKTHIKTMSEKLQASEQLTKENTDFKNEIAALKITVDALKQSKSKNAPASPGQDVNKMKAVIIELKKRLKSQCDANDSLVKKLETAESKDVATQDEIKELKSKVEDLVSSRSRLEEKLGFKADDFYESYTSLKSGFENAQSEIADLKSSSESYSVQVLDLNKSIEDLRAENVDLANKVNCSEDVSIKANELTQENESLRAKVVAIQKSLDESKASTDLETQVRDLLDENAKLQNDLEEAEQRRKEICEEFESELASTKTNLKILEDEKAGIGEKLEKVESKLNDAVENAALVQDRLETDVQGLREENLAVVTENENLKLSSLKYDEEFKSKDSELADLGKRNCELSEEIEQLSNECSCKAKLLEDTEESVTKLRDEKLRLETKLEALQQGADSQNLLQAEIDGLREEKDRLEATVRDYEQNIKDAKDEICELRKESETKVLELSEANLSLRKDLDDKCESLDDVQKLLGEESVVRERLENGSANEKEFVKTLTDKLADVESKYSDVCAELESNCKDRNSLESEISGLREKLCAARNKIDGFERGDAENSKISSDFEELKQIHENLKVSLDSSLEENKELSARYYELESRFNKVEEHCLRFQTEAAEKDAELMQMVELVEEESERDRKIAALESEKEGVRKELELTKEKLENSQSSLEEEDSDRTAKYNSMLEVNQNLQTEISNLKESIDAKDATAVAVTSQLENLRAQSEKADDELRFQSGENENLKNEVVTLQNQIDSLKKESEAESKRKDGLLEIKNNENGGLRENLEEYSKQIENLRNELETMKNVIVEKESELENLKSKHGKDLEELQESNASLRQQIDFEKQQALDKDSCIAELRAQIANTETRLQESRSESVKSMETAEEKSESEIADLKTELSNLQKVYRKSEFDLLSSRSRFKDLVKFTAELEENLTGVKALLNEKESEIAIELRNRSETESELSVLKEKYEELAVGKKKLVKEASQASDKCAQLETQVESLTVELGVFKSKENEAAQKSDAGNAEARENLEQTLKAKDEYCNKLKVIAVKSKKELEATKKKLKSAEDETAALAGQIQTLTARLQGSQTQASNVQMMQLECDKLQDRLDHAEDEKKVLQKNLDDIVAQLKKAQAEKNEVEEGMNQWKAKCDALENEKKDISQLLTMTKATSEMLEAERNRQMNEIENMKKNEEQLKEKVASLDGELNRQKSSLADTKQHLSEAKKGMKQHDMLALEIAQYERSVSELNDTIETLNENLRSEKENSRGLEERLAKINEDRNTVEQLRIDAEDRTNQTNKQLAACREEMSEMESRMEEMKGQLADAMSQVQEFQQETESVKLELSNNSAEVRKLQDKIITMDSTHTRSSDIMQRKVNTLQADCELLKTEKDSLESEYESYKIRVHTVLKQQKSKNQVQEQKSEDEEKIAQLTSANEQLKQRLVNVQNKARLQENEFQLVNSDYERLLQQHEQDKERAADRDARWKSRVQELQLELSTLQRQHGDAATQTRLRNDNLTARHRIEMENLKEAHGKALADLQKKLQDTENDLLRSQTAKASHSRGGSEVTNRASSTPHKRTNLPSPIPPSSARQHSDLVQSHHRNPSYQQMDYRALAREDAEGEEDPDVPQTFERLLSAGSEIRAVSVISDSSMTSEGRQKYLEARYEAQTKKLDHLAEVVRENEATVSRLTEQNRVLKDEIRRLEKNQERETSVANMEYLKNVLYKFITLPPCDEKKHLLPVIDTMLKFDPTEKATLQAMAADDGTDQSQKGWSGYFQRWSGLQ